MRVQPKPKALTARGVSAGYRGATTIRDIDLDVATGETVAVLGPNGAGKTTLMKALSGVLPISAGTLSVGNTDVTGRTTRDLLALGLTHVPEGREVFPEMTVDDNLWLGAFSTSSGHAEQRDLVFDLFPRLAERRRQRADTLSGGEQQMLAIGRALMSRPSILLLDEPSLGLAPVLVQDLAERIQRMARELHLACVLVEQNNVVARDIAEWIYVMVDGGIVAEASASELTDQDLMQLFLGRRPSTT